MSMRTRKRLQRKTKISISVTDCGLVFFRPSLFFEPRIFRCSGRAMLIGAFNEIIVYPNFVGLKAQVTQSISFMVSHVQLAYSYRQ
jgi:hypothetical protein